MKYSIKELNHLRNIRLLGLNDSFLDDKHDTERGFFLSETDRFFKWIEEMERKNKIKDMLLLNKF